jgi:tetratricopeptide (TPR) repeat protein
MLQAYGLYLLVLTSLRRGRAGMWILGMLQAVMLFGLMGAFFQFYLFPEWMVTLARERNPDYLHGAAGFLMDPANLGALLILFWPASVIAAVLPCFPGPVRLLNAFFIFLLGVGLVLSSSLAGILLFGGLMLVIPFFLSAWHRERWKHGRILWLGALGLLPVFYFGTDILRERLLRYLQIPVDGLGEASIVAAWGQFWDRPLLGQGLGAFRLHWEAFRPEGVEGVATYPVSVPLGILAELGLVGAVLLGLPLFYLLVRAFRVWYRLPFLHINKDIRERMARFPAGHPTRARMERTMGRASAEKVILGGLLAGMTAFLLYECRDTALFLPFFIFLMAILAACLAGWSWQAQEKRRAASRWGLAMGVLPMLLFSLAALFGVPRFEAEYRVTTADERLEYLLADPDRIYLEPDRLQPVRADYAAATRLNPAHAAAWTGLGRSWLAALHAELEAPATLAAEALPSLRRAVDLAPESWVARFELARALVIHEPGAPEAETHLREARRLAPLRVEPRAFQAALRVVRGERAEAALRELRELVPQLSEHPSLDLLARELTGRAGVLAGTDPVDTFREVFPESFLAARFDLRGYPVKRVLGAGRMPEPEPVTLLEGPGESP